MSTGDLSLTDLSEPSPAVFLRTCAISCCLYSTYYSPPTWCSSWAHTLPQRIFLVHPTYVRARETLLRVCQHLQVPIAVYIAGCTMCLHVTQTHWGGNDLRLVSLPQLLVAGLTACAAMLARGHPTQAQRDAIVGMMQLAQLIAMDVPELGTHGALKAQSQQLSQSTQRALGDIAWQLRALRGSNTSMYSLAAQSPRVLGLDVPPVMFPLRPDPLLLTKPVPRELRPAPELASSGASPRMRLGGDRLRGSSRDPMSAAISEQDLLRLEAAQLPPRLLAVARAQRHAGPTDDILRREIPVTIAGYDAQACQDTLLGMSEGPLAKAPQASMAAEQLAAGSMVYCLARHIACTVGLAHSAGVIEVPLARRAQQFVPNQVEAAAAMDWAGLSTPSRQLDAASSSVLAAPDTDSSGDSCGRALVYDVRALWRAATQAPHSWGWADWHESSLTALDSCHISVLASLMLQVQPSQSASQDTLGQLAPELTGGPARDPVVDAHLAAAVEAAVAEPDFQRLARTALAVAAMVDQAWAPSQYPGALLASLCLAYAQIIAAPRNPDELPDRVPALRAVDSARAATALRSAVWATSWLKELEAQLAAGSAGLQAYLEEIWDCVLQHVPLLQAGPGEA